jgi:hypothetical protein
MITKTECRSLLSAFFNTERKGIMYGYEDLQTVNFYVNFLIENVVDDFDDVQYVKSFVGSIYPTIGGEAATKNKKVRALKRLDILRFANLFRVVSIPFKMRYIKNMRFADVEGVKSLLESLGVDLVAVDFDNLYSTIKSASKKELQHSGKRND